MGLLTSLVSSVSKTIGSTVNSLKNISTVLNKEVVKPIVQAYPSVINTVTSIPKGAVTVGTSVAKSPTVAKFVDLAKSAVVTAVKNPGKTAVAGVLVPTAVSFVSSNPQSVVDAGKAYTDLVKTGVAIGSGKDVKETIKSYVTEHPVASTAVAVGTALVVGKQIPAGIAYALGESDIGGKNETSKPINPATESLPTNNYQGTQIASKSPVTPARTVVTAGTRKTYKRKKKVATTQQPVRVNVVQVANSRIFSTKYLN